MEQVVTVARTLRVEHGFNGYLHLKTIPEASQGLIDEAGRWADRISINTELPTTVDLERLAPEKNIKRIDAAMGRIRQRIDAAVAEESSLLRQPDLARKMDFEAFVADLQKMAE